MQRNKGSTLIEVIVACVILGIVAVSSMNGFAVARQTNRIASKYVQAENLTASITEQLLGTDFENLQEANGKGLNPNNVDGVIKLPGGFRTSENWTISENNVAQFSMFLDEIKGVNTYYKVRVNLDSVPYDDNYNDKQFIELATISDTNTCIIDTVGATNIYDKEQGEFIYRYTVTDLKYYVQHSDNSYDNQAVQHFSELNTAYLTRKWKEECDRIDEWNAAHEEEGMTISYPEFGVGVYALASNEMIKSHLRKVTNITLYETSLFTFIDTSLDYELDQNSTGSWVPIIEDNGAMSNPSRKVSFSIMTNAKYRDIENLFLMDVRLTDDWLSDEIQVTNGTSIENGIDFNFYLVEQPFDSDGNEVVAIGSFNDNPIYNAPNITITSLNNSNIINIYTNTNLTLASAGIADSVTYLYTDKIHKLQDKYTRLYSVTVIVYDDKGAHLAEKTTTVLR